MNRELHRKETTADRWDANTVRFAKAEQEYAAAGRERAEIRILLLEELRQRDVHPLMLEKLTMREQEVLVGVQRGLRNKEIADQLNISERTIKFHVSSLLEKFKVATRQQL